MCLYRNIAAKSVFILVLITIGIGLYISSMFSYNLFHSLVEISTITVGFAIFILAWNTRKYLENNYLKILGFGYVFIAIVDLMHTLTYKGMNVYPSSGANLPTQLWIAARYLQAVTLAGASFFISRRKIFHHLVVVIFVAVTSLLLAAVFSGFFPDCFIEGKGLTAFKILSEYVISAILLASIILLYRKRDLFNRRIFNLIIASIACTIISEISFTTYVSVFGFANLFGHFLKLAAFYLIYHAILSYGLREPFNLIFRDLNQAKIELRKTNEVLEQKVLERTAELRHLNRELREAQRVGRFGSWDWDARTNRITWSRENYRIYGFNPGKKPPGYVEFLKSFTQESAAILDSAVKRNVGTGESYEIELELANPTGPIQWVMERGETKRDKSGSIIGIRGTTQDITEHRRNLEINESRMHLLRFAESHSFDELLEESVNKAEKLTGSSIGFYHLVDDSRKSITLQCWSTRTKKEFCKAERNNFHYPIADAGVWVDCLYQRKPVIHNDYASLPNRKGMPEGYADLIRELTIPIMRDNKIWAILGVGNKPSDYTDNDIEAVSLLADLTLEIAEKKMAEEKILRSDQRLRLHHNYSPLGFLEWDENFKAVEWNAACERIFGYTREEAIGRHAKELILPVEVHDLVDGIYESLMNQTGGQHSINENITKDGRVIICEWFNTTLIDKNGKAIGVASVCKDITDQKRMEEELTKYREHLEEQVKERTFELENAKNKTQQYLDIADVILVAIDKNRKITMINQKGCDILGYDYKDIIGKDCFETVIPENSRSHSIQMFMKLMSGDNIPAEYIENPILTRSGEIRLFAWHNVLLKDSEGNITGTLSSGEDITERKQAEEKIIELNQDLQNRAAALEAANRELEEKNLELERMNRLFVGRELRMIELKEKLKDLQKISKDIYSTKNG